MGLGGEIEEDAQMVREHERRLTMRVEGIAKERETESGAGKRTVLAKQPRSQECRALLGSPCARTGLMQVWLDVSESLSDKFAMAKEKGIRGVGPFTWTGAVRSDPAGPPGMSDDWLAAIWKSLDVFGPKEVQSTHRGKEMGEESTVLIA
uniref:Uncharacterized protein n=1 Tax=Chromera velia CCMP2878 TaxID=1169474 RepID=A0A0G4IF51_9ALVE|eukprot:Cvel_13871.t1-p1 / transcript=Cvel_13871.t1 / gene=Cvel_13871 / organism=Chromera_velia_CCMP2878 / gene_product=hypothetical protein / transcript_product=hypothetical protein / location=Cvel_scaffold965:4933-5710(+) / protein_length=149 / sequence_SO=supercontig / SO=protein_coding / is_pseudo=false